MCEKERKKERKKAERKKERKKESKKERRNSKNEIPDGLKYWHGKMWKKEKKLRFNKKINKKIFIEKIRKKCYSKFLKDVKLRKKKERKFIWEETEIIFKKEKYLRNQICKKERKRERKKNEIVSILCNK